MKLRIAFLVVIALLVGAVSPALANPFSDVPADHWAYDSISKLAAVGLVEGYPDGTYGGARMMTRYEAAMVFARTLARMESLIETSVAEETAGVKEDITAEVLKDIEAAKAELVDLIKTELANLEVPVVEKEVETIVEKTVVEQPVEKIVERQPIERPFQMTPEAETVIRNLVEELAKEQLAQAKEQAKEDIIETRIVEQVVVEKEEVDEETIKALAEEALAKQLQDLQIKMMNANRDIKNNAFFINELNSKVTGLEEDVDALGADVEALGSDVDELKAAQEAMADDLFASENWLLALIDGVQNDVDGLRDALESEVADLEASIQDLWLEFDFELEIMGMKLERLESVFEDVDGRLTALESDYAEFKTETERVKLSGATDVSVTKTSVLDADNNDAIVDGPVLDIFGDDFSTETAIEQNLELKLSVKASDTTTVNAIFSGAVEDMDFGEFDPEVYALEVLSETPVQRLVAGTLDEDEVEERFSGYVLDTKPDFGFMADVELAGIEAKAIAGNGPKAGVAVSYELTPEFGVKGAVTGIFGDDFKATDSAGLAGVFGTIVGVNYDAVVAIDKDADVASDNFLYDVKADTKVGDLSFHGNWARADQSFGEGDLVSRGFYLLDTDGTDYFDFTDAGKQTKLALGAGVDFLGISLTGDIYRESLESGAPDQALEASMLTAEQELNLVVPITLSGSIGRMNAESMDVDSAEHSKFKVAVEELALGSTDFTVGSSFAVVNNWIDSDDFVWQDPQNWTGLDVNVLTADLGYEGELANAVLTLGYGYELTMPRGDLKDVWSNIVTHKVDAGYKFTEDAGLSLSAKQVSGDYDTTNDGSPDGTHKVNEVKAGLELKF